MVEAKNSNLAKVPKDLLNKYKSLGQEHVVKFINDLKEKEFEAFIAQLKSIDLEKVLAEFQTTSKATTEVKTQIKPLNEDCLLINEKDKDLWDIGLKAIKEKKVAVITLAGGQGTRLGSSKPKGCYDIGLPSGMSLFQIQALRLQKIAKLAGNPAIPWYIMISSATEEETKKFFEENKWFGVSKESIKFFKQGELPSLTEDGKLILSSKGSLAMSPNGNGGIYTAIRENGILEELKSKGIEYIHLYCVDNALVKVADPSFIGACIKRQADCGSKSISKVDPAEPVGIFCLNEKGKLAVAEYSELDSSMSAKRAVDGTLAFGQANIANHILAVPFLEKAISKPLPIHLARKKIPGIDETTGEMLEKPKIGYKLESFIFDIFSWADKPLVFQCERSKEFAPLKNASGSPLDSPEYCRKMLIDLHKSWLEELEISVEGEVEISPLISYEGEGLEKYKKENVKLKGFINK